MKYDNYDWNSVKKYTLVDKLPLLNQPSTKPLFGDHKILSIKLSSYGLMVDKELSIGKYDIETRENCAHFRENISKQFEKIEEKNFIQKEKSIEVVKQSEIDKPFKIQIVDAKKNFSPTLLEPIFGNKYNDIHYYVEVSLFFGGELISQPQITKLVKNVKKYFQFLFFY